MEWVSLSLLVWTQNHGILVFLSAPVMETFPSIRTTVSPSTVSKAMDLRARDCPKSCSYALVSPLSFSIFIYFNKCQ